MTNVHVFWGGEICQHATPPALYYNVDVQAVIPLQLQSGFNGLKRMIKRAMRLNDEESITVIGRVILHTPFGITHSAYHITTEAEWQYFIEQTLPLGELHVYIISETYVRPQSPNEAAFFDANSSPYVHHSAASTSVPSSSHNMNTFSDSSESSVAEPILSGSSKSSDDEDRDESISFDFDSMEATAGQGQTIPQPSTTNIPFCHSAVSPPTTTFSHGFTETDDTGMQSYDPATNAIQVNMVFPGFAELKKAVTLYSMRHRRTFITKHKKKTNWRIVCPHFHSTENSCMWNLSAKKLRGASSEWMVTKFIEPHVCTANYNEGGCDRMCTSTLISDLIFHKINVDPQYKIKHIQVDVRQHYGVDITYKKAWYARQKCIELQYGKFRVYNITLFFII